MDVFGKLVLRKHQNPESLNKSTLDKLVDVAQSAFDKKGQPTYEDVEDHIVPSNTFVTAEIDNEIMGFSSTDHVADITYAVGLAIQEDFQGNGIGKIARTYGVLEEMSEQDIIATRTQNPAVLSYMQDLFDGFPKQEGETPEYISEALENLAYELDQQADFDQKSQVMSEAYPGSMYEEIPEHELRELTDQLLDYEEGDALIIGGEKSRPEIQDVYENLKKSRNYEIEEI